MTLLVLQTILGKFPFHKAPAKTVIEFKLIATGYLTLL